MPINLLPLTARLRDKIRSESFQDTASSIETIAPSERRDHQRALHLADDLDRILGYQIHTTPAQEHKIIAGGPAVHGATQLRQYRDARIIDGTVYCGKSFANMTIEKRRPVVLEEYDHVKRAMLCTDIVVDRYFGHWITDGLTYEALARQQGLAGLTISKRRWLHETHYRSLAGLFDQRLRVVRIDELYVADDRGLNSNRIARMQAIRKAVTAKLLPASQRRPVFISRGKTGAQRTLINQAQVVAALERRGFDIIEPEICTAEDIAMTIYHAPLVLSVEGSAQAHAFLALPRGGTMLTIMPPRTLTAVMKIYADALDIRWGFTIADDAGKERFHQPVDRLLRLIDTAMDAA